MRLYATLTDLDMIAQTIPDLVSSERVDETLKCVVRPGFSFLRGTLKTTISLAEFPESPNSATMNVAARASAFRFASKSRLRISAEGTGSRLDWKPRSPK